MEMDITEWTREELDAWFVLVHRELRALATSQRRRRGLASNAGTTSLLHLTYERMARQDVLNVKSTEHFFAIAARVMRHVLINRAEAMSAQKRGGGVRPTSFDEIEPWLQGRSLRERDLVRMLDMESALDALAMEDQELARLVEHHIHLGMTLGEYAELRQTSLSTIKRRWRLARAYLTKYLDDEPHSP